jgi:hypothetical protein
MQRRLARFLERMALLAWSLWLGAFCLALLSGPALAADALVAALLGRAGPAAVVAWMLAAAARGGISGARPAGFVATALAGLALVLAEAWWVRPPALAAARPLGLTEGEVAALASLWQQRGIVLAAAATLLWWSRGQSRDVVRRPLGRPARDEPLLDFDEEPDDS